MIENPNLLVLNTKLSKMNSENIRLTMNKYLYILMTCWYWLIYIIKNLIGLFLVLKLLYIQIDGLILRYIMGNMNDNIFLYKMWDL